LNLQPIVYDTIALPV